MGQVGPSRTTQIAEVVVVAPITPVEVGLQFRAQGTSSGYRAKLTIDADGNVSGAFSRVASRKQTSLKGGAELGFKVSPGDRIHLEATVAAKKTVRLYLRAWKEGATKPSAWQLVAKDSSSKRISQSGSVYLWGRTPAGSPTITLGYDVESVATFSATKAAKIGVVAPLVSDTSFSIAVIGDTQEETDASTDSRFPDRTAWLAKNKTSLNLQYVLHTGDMVNWGWLVPSQYTVAKAAMRNLTTAGIPFSPAIGNHDTRAVGWNGIAGSTGYGGSTYASNPECVTKLGASACNTKLLVRKTDEFNSAFPVSGLTAQVGGAFESGKVDNIWTTFSANDTKWLVMSLEFAPRKTAVEWARKVVASHSDYNVIIATHYYLDEHGKISASNAGYGDTSGQYLYKQIVSKYSNVKIVTSGHVGSYTSRTDTNNGNRVVSYLGDKLGASDNPLRILTINTSTGVVANTVYRTIKGSTATSYSTGKNTITITR
ncbi:metallophosphoesterase [Micropruina sp.]|uniref:metallophosphoesterase n=1 Tax=Micropruina sp. TaxID=2737536 RepID=UPI0039E324C6